MNADPARTRRRSPLLVATVACFLGAVLVAPPVSAAAVAQVEGSTLVYRAGEEEENAVEIFRSSDGYVVGDVTAVSPGPGCSQAGDAIEPDTTTVVCAAGGISGVGIDVGDRDDSAVLLARVPARIAGGPGNDELSGAGANDVLDGGTGRDIVRGGLGDDLLDGGPDGDEGILGEDGNDTILARDGAVDEGVSCGVGADVVSVDAGDERAPDCERVSLPCSPRVSVPSRVRTTRSGSVRLRVSCYPAGCPGAVSVRARGTNRQLGRRSFVAGASSSAVTVRLGRGARRLLNRRKKLAASATFGPGTKPGCPRRKDSARFTLLKAR